MANVTILVVDDELPVRRLLSDGLSRAGYMVEQASCGAEALARLQHPGIDLLLLDLQLGDMDGVAVMEVARRSWPRLPIIMLTAHGSLASAIAAVRCAAADYVLKPVSMAELRERTARVLHDHGAAHQRYTQLQLMYSQMQRILQHEGLLAGQTEPALTMQAGPLSLDPRQYLVCLHGLPIETTPSEFAILRELLQQPGAVVSCLVLARATGTAASDEDEARQLVRPHVMRLRRKLEAEPQQPRYLISVRGIGYRWASDGSGSEG